MKPAGSTESLKTWQRRSERTRQASQRECLVFLGRDGAPGENWLSAESNARRRCNGFARNPGSASGTRGRSGIDRGGNLDRDRIALAGRSRSPHVWQKFQMISYFRIAMAKNMKGMILACGLCIATSLVSLAARS
jgi:hypothetical protein